MKTVAYRACAALSEPDALYDTEAPAPAPGPRDVLVAVRAVSVNPVDTKVRAGSVQVPEGVDTLGWDAAGVVVGVGSEVSLFAVGDEVFYAGTFTRAGANAELHCVDERLVGFKPSSLNFAEAAAMPLTSLTAWELLFERLRVAPGKRPDSGTLLVIGGAGGVGSMLIQLARRLTGLTVIATASRPESRAWCLELGAHHVLDHHASISEQLAALGYPQVSHVAALTHTARHLGAIAQAVAVHGQVVIIDDHDTLDIVPFKAKSISLHWEMVFTRPLYQTGDMIAHHHILNEVAALVDAGVLKSTLRELITPFTAASLRKAHALVEQGDRLGKVVVARQ